MTFTKKEKFIYTMIICFLMEFIMAYYHYFFHTSAFLHEAFVLAIAEFIPAFIIGVICEWFIVSRIAKKVALMLHKEHFSDHTIIHTNELLIAIGMVIVISMYGAILHANELQNLSQLIINDFFKNVIVGIPLFMFVVGPFARYILKLISQ